MSERSEEAKSYLAEIERLQMRVFEMEKRLADRSYKQDSDSIFRLVYNAMTEGMALHRLLFDEYGKPDDYKILDVNPSYESITGLSRELAVGAKASELYGTGDPPYFDIFCKVATGGASEVFDTYFSPMQKHFKITVFSPDKNVFATVFSDISEQVKAVQKLERSEMLFRTITETALDSIFIKDTERRYTFVNPAMCSLFDVEEKDLLGKTPEELFDPESASKINAVDLPVLRGKVINEVRSIMVGEDLREFNTLQVPLKNDDGKVVGMVGIVRDVTEQHRKQAEQRHVQKLEAIGTLAGGVAHEINNPINIISNFAELIRDTPGLDANLVDYSGEIIKESNRVAVIVSNLLLFARKDRDSHSPARMQDIINSTLSLTRKILAKDGIRVETEIQPDLPKCRCRNQQIMQVLMNLITNARDALNHKYKEHDPDKIIRLECLLMEREDHKWIRITVQDFGIGIEQESLDKIFDPFYTTKSRDQGTGLGLAVSQRIVKGHNGVLSAESENGSTRFHMDIPIDNG